MDFLDLQDAVTIGVAVRVRPIPLRVDRVADHLPRLATRTAAVCDKNARLPGARIDAEIQHFIAEVRAGEQHVPTNASRLPQLSSELRFMSPTLRRANVEQRTELRCARRRREIDVDERVLGLLLPERVFEVQPVVQKLGVKSPLELSRSFRLEIRIT